jgi:HK97 family phage major capsid protein
MSTTADRLKELQATYREKSAANQAIVNSLETDESGTYHMSSEHKKEFDRNVEEMRNLRSTMESLQAQVEGEKWMNGVEGSVAQEVSAGAEASKRSERPSRKSIGEMFVASDEFKALHGGRAGAHMASPFELKMANIGSLYRPVQKDIYAGMSGEGNFPWGGTLDLGMIDRVRRTQRVRDLFSVRTTTATTIEYFRVTGFVNGADMVPQRNPGNTAFALKPQSTLSFAAEQAPIRTIAHWEAAHRYVLADEPALRGIIDTELLYGLRLVEDAQILSGSGTGEDLRGILNTPGIQNYRWSDGATEPVPDTKADAIRRAATLAFLAQYEPTGVVVHPNDWEDIELTKNTNGDYLLAVSIALGGEQRVWRMPVIDSPAIPEGTALLGSFGIGAQLYDREEANIRVAEQHADFFIRNAVVILAEQRLGLTVTRPESFVEITFDGAPEA